MASGVARLLVAAGISTLGGAMFWSALNEFLEFVGLPPLGDTTGTYVVAWLLIGLGIGVALAPSIISKSSGE